MITNYMPYPFYYRDGYPKSLHLANVYFPNEVSLPNRVKYYFKASVAFSSYEEYLLSLIVKQGWKDFEEARVRLNLPDKKHIVVDCKEKVGFVFSGIDDKLVIRNMLVLAACGENIYYPDNPLIFSDKRMNRQIELKRIQLNEFYDVD